MIESLVVLGEIYTYLLTNPSAGIAHAAYAFRLLRIRDYEGLRDGRQLRSVLRTQDLPDPLPDPLKLDGRTLAEVVTELKGRPAGPNPYDYAREQIGNVYYALARLRRTQGKPDDARAAFEASLAIREPLKTLSARKGVAATLHSLAGLLHAHGHDVEAKVAIERAISMKEAIYGTEPNEEVSASLHNLGSILLKLGDLEGAEVAIKRSLDMKKEVFGTTHHISVAETALLAAWLLIEMGGWSEAMPILRYAQSVFRDLAPESPQLAQIDAILAS
jgi:tetratricopeptide (TPR) repeat protein